MQYGKIVIDDATLLDKPNIAFYTQGCPFRCTGCNNPKGWLFDHGEEFTSDVLDKLLKNCKGRILCISGGEPLHPDNQFLTNLVITEVKKVYPNIQIYLWTGYYYKDLVDKHEKLLQNIINNIDVLIDGPYNFKNHVQNIIELKEI